MADDNLWRDRNKVFVAGIPAHADDDALYQKFCTFGEMFQSKVVYDNKTGKSKGFGFITFADYAHALEAVSQMNQTKWDNRVLNVRFLQPKPDGTSQSAVGQQAPVASRPTKAFGPCPPSCTSVYVGNLAYGITEPVLRKVFVGCGDVKAVRFAEHIETKEFRGFGHVQFYDSAACAKAVLLDGMVVMGRPMNLDYGSRDDATEKAREDFQRKLKKGICHRFQSSDCPRGEDCKFAHVLSTQDATHGFQSSELASAVSSSMTPLPTAAVEMDVPICQSFLKGKCKRGDKCKFQHIDATTPTDGPHGGSDHSQSEEPVMEEDEDVEPICQSFLKGKCKRGEKCKFRHIVAPTAEAAQPAVAAPASVVRASVVATPRSIATTAVPDVPTCLNFQKGTCKRGNSCRFRHVKASEELVEDPTVAPEAEDVAMPAPVVPTAADADTPMCQNYLKGKCKRGAACRFRHVEPEDVPVVSTPAVVPAISICKNFQRGRCMRGTSCRFAHTDGEDADVAAAAAEAAVVAAAVISTAHSDYQKRFQSVCYNWQNARSCVRGDECPFFHDGTAKPAETGQVNEPEEVADMDEGEDGPRSKKLKKEKKEKKSKKRKASDLDDESKSESDKKTLKKHKKTTKHKTIVEGSD